MPGNNTTLAATTTHTWENDNAKRKYRTTTIISGAVAVVAAIGIVTQLYWHNTPTVDAYTTPDTAPMANVDITNDKTNDTTYAHDAVDAATALYRQTWENVKLGGLADVQGDTRLIKDDRKSDIYTPAVSGMLKTGRNSTGIFMGKPDILSSVTVFDTDKYPYPSHRDAGTREEAMVLCMKQNEQQIRYVDYHATADTVNGSSSWIVLAQETENGWKITSAIPQDKGCRTPNGIQ